MKQQGKQTTNFQKENVCQLIRCHNINILINYEEKNRPEAKT